jgi:LysW-gamma-L-lysine/LysW-L-ornithine aminotransferase
MNPREIEDQRLAPVFPKKPIDIVRGEGSLLFGPRDERYIDLGANFSVANIGHSHPRIVRTIQEQAKRLTHLQQTIYSPQRAEFLEELGRVLPAETPRVFLSNSGTEAIEAALKWSRAATGRTKFVAARNSFHGRTFGAMSLTWKPDYRKPFEPLLSGVDFTPYNDPAALDALVTDETACVVLEPVQGEGGVTPATRDFLRQARQSCDEHGALLVLDEIQTGLGRAGHWWGHQAHNVVPDIMCIAKSIAGGLPMGVTAFREDVAGKIPKGSHGTTFGGSPLVCAVAAETLRILRGEKLPERSRTEGAYVLERLKKAGLPLARDIRGQGLMIGLELRIKPQPVLEALLHRNVLALQAGTTVLRLLPPLNIPRSILDEGLAVVEDVVRTLKPPVAAEA